MRRAALVAVWGLTLLAPLQPFSTRLVRADIVYLKDGTKVEGEVVRKSDAGWIVRTADGKSVNIAADRVRSFEARRGATANADESMKRLLSLRRAVEAQTDIPKILERYRAFIEQHVGTPAADEALQDVQVWEQRLEQRMVKVGDKWVTKEEQARMNEKALERAEEARSLLVQGRLKEALAELDSAIGEDSSSAAGHYLRGVVLYRQEQVANARKAFETALQLAPNHGPTLNNLAVIMWGSKQYPGSLNFYGQAMNAAPNTRLIVDNVAEALNELPKSQRDNASTKKVVLLFNAQDMVLQARMKERGLVRWGSTWVSGEELKELEDQEEQIEEKIERLEDEFEKVQDRMEQIERDIADTERSIRRIEASSYGRDSSGRPVRLSYPRLYYDLKRDLEQLNLELDAEKAKVARLRKSAREAQQDLSVPRYAGVQQIIGVEGTPGLPPLADSGAGEAADAPAPATAPVAG